MFLELWNLNMWDNCCKRDEHGFDALNVHMYFQWLFVFTAILSLCASVLTVTLIPVDIFLVSSMKDTNGTFEVNFHILPVIMVENSVCFVFYSTIRH